MYAHMRYIVACPYIWNYSVFWTISPPRSDDWLSYGPMVMFHRTMDLFETEGAPPIKLDGLFKYLQLPSDTLL